MKLNKKKISALLGVGLISALTFGPTLNTQADLDYPDEYTFGYYSSGTNWTVEGIETYNNPQYTRVGTSSPYTYYTTINLAVGLTIIVEVTNSNSSWTSIEPFYPTNNITTSTGYIAVHVLNTNFIDYLSFFDFSDSASGHFIVEQTLQGESVSNPTFQYNYQYNETTGVRYMIPSLTSLIITTFEINSKNLAGVWFEELGYNQSYLNGGDIGYGFGYDDGYDDGYGNSPNLLITGFQAMVGILVNFVLMIVNLEVFGVSILGIFSIVVLFTGIVWVLKLIRG